MKKVMSYVFVFIMALFTVTNVFAYTYDTNIVLPDNLNNGDNTFTTNGLDGYSFYYSVINLNNNDEFLTSYDSYNSSLISKEDIDGKVDVLVAEANFEESTNKNFNASYTTGDKLLVVIKATDGNDEVYGYKVYYTSDTQDTQTPNKTVDNTKTGIEDYALVIVPILLTIGVVITTKKNQYN